MRTLAGLLVAASLVALVAACGGDSDEPSPTAAGATAVASATRAASPTAVNEATATATRTPSPPTPTRTPTPAPTDTPSATPEPPTATTVPPTSTSGPTLPSAPPPQSGGAQSLFLKAKSLKFEPTTLYATAGGSVTITLSNQDNIVPHNVSVSGLGTSETCQGPCTTTLSFLAPPRGSYQFTCTIHPYMKGTLIVQ